MLHRGTSINNDWSDEIKEGEPGPSTSRRRSFNSQTDEVTGKMKSQEQLSGEDVVRKILLSGVPGATYSYRYDIMA